MKTKCKCCGLPAQFCYRDRLAPLIEQDQKENLVKHPLWDVNPIASDAAIQKQIRADLWRRWRGRVLWWALGFAMGVGVAVAAVLR